MWDNFWELRVNQRLTGWKLFRQKIGELDLEEALQTVNNTWDRVPYVTFYLADDDPASWPDPWTLIAENYYCDLAKALGMLYTLYFSEHADTDMQLEIYYDHRTKERYYLLSVQSGKYILNCWPQQIVNTEQIANKKLKLVYQYSKSDLNLEKY